MAKKLLFLFFTFFTLNIYAQNVTMTGTVVDVENLPLIGVNVIIKGSTVGTTTDLDGNFSLEGKKGDVLVFSYIGMVSQEIAFKGQPLKIIMKDDSEALDEVVVIGYQSVKKSDLTGAVAVVDAKEMKKSAAGTITSQLQGCKHSVNHVFSSPTSIINFTSKKPSYDDTRRSGSDNELLQRAQNGL